jgi:DNA-binding transcriptional ArsR family regulator
MTSPRPFEQPLDVSGQETDARSDGETPSRPTRRQVDANSLRGLAHPLRVQLCDQLGLHGSSTATLLAEALGESTGATSYHLRQLEKYGFVEEDTERCTGRERWWRRVPGGISINSTELDDSPTTRDAAMLVVNEVHRAKQARLDQWRMNHRQWPTEWVRASAEASLHIKLTVEEMATLGDELDALVTSWIDRVRDRTDGERRNVELQLSYFPIGNPPESGERPVPDDRPR